MDNDFRAFLAGLDMARKYPAVSPRDILPAPSVIAAYLDNYGKCEMMRNELSVSEAEYPGFILSYLLLPFVVSMWYVNLFNYGRMDIIESVNDIQTAMMDRVFGLPGNVRFGDYVTNQLEVNAASQASPKYFGLQLKASFLPDAQVDYVQLVAFLFSTRCNSFQHTFSCLNKESNDKMLILKKLGRSYGIEFLQGFTKNLTTDKAAHAVLHVSFLIMDFIEKPRV